MPDEDYWESLFDVSLILDALGVTRALVDVAELGCGFGTFSIPVAQRIAGRVSTFDIDANMVARTEQRASFARLPNLVCRQRDVMEQGFGLPAGSVDAVLLFNILHCESPEVLLAHASDVVRCGGQILVIHWRSDLATPRGPDLAIRPKPQQIFAWAHDTGKLQPTGGAIDLLPWHYGIKLLRDAP
ncbi:MAG: class I SAM-dependent methyltransferase [Pirellulales bacterium]